MLYDIIQLEYTGIPFMKLVLFKCDQFDNTPYIGTRVDKKYQLVEVRQSKRYTKAYDSFIFAQQVEQVYYTTYPEGHQGQLTVMKTKAHSRITDNIVSETKQEAPYQDDELVGLQEVLEVDPDVINESLADVDGGGEEIDVDLLKQLDLVEPNEDKCMLSENDIESDFDDTDTSQVIHTLKLIACLMFIVYMCVCVYFYICMIVVCNNYYFYSCSEYIYIYMYMCVCVCVCVHM